MATQLQIRRGTSAQVAAFTGAEGEIVVNTTNDSVHVNDGSTAGGFELARVDGSNWAITNDIDVIGTVTADKLIVNSGATDEVARFEGTGSPYISWYDTGVRQAYIGSFGNNFSIVGDTPDTTVSISTGGTRRLTVDATGVGIGTIAPARTLDIEAPAAAVEINSTAGGANLFLTSTAGGNLSRIRWNSAAGSFAIRDDSNSADRVVVDSSGRVGIGTSSPTKTLVVNENDSECVVVIKSSDTGSAGVYLGGQSDEIKAGMILDNSTNALILRGYNNAERLRITSSGNIGIGTSSPASLLTIQDATPIFEIDSTTTANTATIQFTSSGTVDSKITHVGNTGIMTIDSGRNSSWGGKIAFVTDTEERMRISNAGNVGIGTSAPNESLHVYHATDNVLVNIESGDAKAFISFKDNSTTNTDTVFLGADGNNMAFYAGSAGTERMRIDSSGNLLVGTTTTDIANNTNTGAVINSGGWFEIARESTTAYFNRLTSDGDIVQFQKDGTKVGSIGVAATNNYFAVGNSNTSIQFYASGIAPATGSTSTLSDNTKDIGSASIRWDDIYATNGTIQTSDRNEKQDIDALSDAEQRVAVAAKGLLRKFRWKSSVAENGDDARIHFGIIAQDLQAAFEAEGLDAGRYAMFINSTWTDEDTGEERTRMGVRYSELLAFIISAI